MKKLSKVMLQNAVELENREMKMILGGSGSNECSGKSKDQCSGSCKDDQGNSGTCGWTTAWSACTCATGSGA